MRIVVAEDHPAVRQAVCDLLGTEPGFQIVAQAEDGQQAVEACHRLHPDVVLMDISLPRINGLEATRQIHMDQPDLPVIALSIHDKSAIPQQRRSDFKAFIRKDQPFEAVVHAIREHGQYGKPSEHAVV